MPREPVSLYKLAKTGSVGGAVLGAFIGTTVAGSHLHMWAASDLGAAFIGCIAFCAFVGCVFFPILVVSLSARGSRGDGPHFRFGSSAKGTDPNHRDGAH